MSKETNIKNIKLVIDGKEQNIEYKSKLTGKDMTLFHTVLANRPKNQQLDKLKDTLKDVVKSKEATEKVDLDVKTLSSLLELTSASNEPNAELLTAFKYEFVRLGISKHSIERFEPLQSSVVNIETSEIDKEAFEFWEEQAIDDVNEIYIFFRKKVQLNNQYNSI